MKGKRYTTETKIRILREAQSRDKTIQDVCRKRQHIPGVAIAVVKDDKVVLAKGFGYRDMETEQPVTPEMVEVT